MTTFDPPKTVYGIDFCADKRDAGRNTWIAKARASGGGGTEPLVVDWVKDASSALGCGPARDETLTALVEKISIDREEQTVFGLALPFSLPTTRIGGRNWRQFVDATPRSWGVLDNVDDPDPLYESAKQFAEDNDGSLRRETDRCSHGQEPTGFRIKTQTYDGISGLLARLGDGVSVLPFEEPTTDVLVIETYPAATFRKLEGRNVDCYDTGYKGGSFQAIERRTKNVRALSNVGVDFGDHHEFAIASDDVLDAVAAAYASWTATRDGRLPDELHADDGRVRSPHDVEGYIFT